MPRYAQNPDGTLTIIDDSSDSHQPSPPPRPTDRRSGQDHSNNGFPVLRARMHVLCIILGILATVMLLCSCSESGGEFAHGMSEFAWTQFRESDTKHSVIERAAAGLEDRESAWDGIFERMANHDWGYGPKMLAPGTEAVFENAQANVDAIAKMAGEGLEQLGLSDENQEME